MPLLRLPASRARWLDRLDDAGIVRVVREAIRSSLSEARASSERRKSKPRAPGKAPSPKPSASEIRAAVDARDEWCVICHKSAPEPWELHHVDSGGGKGQRQSVRNCCKTHEACHRQAHRGDLLALDRLLLWAMFHGYGEAEAAIQRRIHKVREAQRWQAEQRLKRAQHPERRTDG